MREVTLSGAVNWMRVALFSFSLFSLISFLFWRFDLNDGPAQAEKGP